MQSWSGKWAIYEGNRATFLATTDTKLYVPVVTLSTQNNKILLQQLKSEFKQKN